MSVWPTFARDYPLDEDSSSEDFYIYSWMVSSALQFMQENNEPRDRLDEDCLKHMELALRLSTERGSPNAGGYGPLDWLSRMMTPGGKSVPAQHFLDQYPDEFLGFVVACESSEGLIEDLNRLRQVLGFPPFVDVNTNAPPESLSTILRNRSYNRPRKAARMR